MPIDIDPATGAPIVKSPTETNTEAPILTIPPVTSSTPATTSTDDTKVSKVEAKAEVKVFNSRKEEILAKMNDIEREAGGISNIGMTSEYWDLVREYRSL